MIKLVSIIIHYLMSGCHRETRGEYSEFKKLGLNFEYEIIIVDDGSTDSTGSTLKKFNLQTKIYML